MDFLEAKDEVTYIHVYRTGPVLSPPAPIVWKFYESLRFMGDLNAKACGSIMTTTVGEEEQNASQGGVASVGGAAESSSGEGETTETITPTSTGQPSAKKLKKDNRATILEQCYDALKSPQQQQALDDCDRFGQMIADELRTITGVLRDRTKFKIQALIMEMKWGTEFMEPSPSHQEYFQHSYPPPPTTPTPPTYHYVPSTVVASSSSTGEPSTTNIMTYQSL